VTPLIAGTLLMLAALAFVLYPLIVAGPAGADPRLTPEAPVIDPARNDAIDALREIEFDRATGTLSDSDYDSLKSTYTQRAVDAIRSQGAATCARCGPRPEKEALFCSRCGAALT
jgi:hypothetical protein